MNDHAKEEDTIAQNLELTEQGILVLSDPRAWPEMRNLIQKLSNHIEAISHGRHNAHR